MEYLYFDLFFHCLRFDLIPRQLHNPDGVFCADLFSVILLVGGAFFRFWFKWKEARIFTGDAHVLFLIFLYKKIMIYITSTLDKINSHGCVRSKLINLCLYTLKEERKQ